MSAIHSILENPLIYKAWQSPFVAKKLEPLVSLDIFKQAKSVLDLGCGPGIKFILFF